MVKNNENTTGLNASTGEGRRLFGRNALITGGSHGLGYAIAKMFLAEGANVVICARDSQALSKAANELASDLGSNQKLRAKSCDVSSEEQVNALFSFAMAEFGSMEILVNNAGVYGPMGPTETVPMTEWRRALEINLFGVL